MFPRRVLGCRSTGNSSDGHVRQRWMPECVDMVARLDELSYSGSMSDTKGGVMRHGFSRRVFVVIGGAALILAAAAGLAAASRPVSGSGTWVWDQRLPGRLIERPASQQAVQISPNIVPGSAREVVTISTGARSLTLLSARGTAGDVCLSVTSGEISKEFSCMNELARRQALLTYVASGGSTLGVTDWVRVVGLARGDVGRVTVVLRNGNEKELAFNEWRAYTYETDSDALVPTRIRAYGTDGALIEEVVVA